MKTAPLSLILMVHNEVNTIENEVKSYYSEILKKFPGSEMIIVDDGNTDGTSQLLHKIKNPSLKIIVSPQKIGYAKSLRKSLEASRGELVFLADAGQKHSPKDFWKLYKKISSFDFITGYKRHRHDPFYRLILAWGLNFLTNQYFKVNFSDIDCGFKLFNRKTKEIILATPWILNNNISLEITLRAVASGVKVTEVPVTHFARMHGSSRGLPLSKIPPAVFNILKHFPRLKKEIFQKDD